MKKDTRWHGTDASNEISLFDYGFLMRWSPKNHEYQVVYGLPCNEETEYYYSWFNADDFRKDIKSGNSWINVKGISQTCDWDQMGGIDGLSDENLLSDLISYYGTINIFGDEYFQGYTENEIRKKLGRAL